MYLWNNIALIEDDSHFTIWVKQAKRLDHDRCSLAAVTPYLKGTMVDLGANIGTHSYYYAKFGKVICVEANPIAFECLTHNMQGTDCELYNLAISDISGSKIDIITGCKNYGASFTIPGKTISTIRLDDLQLNECNYIKIDIEGDELLALKGGRQTISKHKPVIYIECNKHTLLRKGIDHNDLIIYLMQLGYKVPHVPDSVIQTDLLCTPN